MGGGNNGRLPGAHHHPHPPPLRVPQADTIDVPGGTEAGQKVERLLAQAGQAGGKSMPYKEAVPG